MVVPGLAVYCFFSLCHGSNDGAAAFACLQEGKGCVNLWQHGRGAKLAFLRVFLCLCHSHMGERRLICFAVIYTYLLHIGQNHKHIGIGLFGEKAADQVFLDDRAWHRAAHSPVP